MKARQDTLITAHARVETALQAAWAEGTAKSSPLAVLLVAFDGGETAAVAAAVDTLERALRVHCGRQRDTVLRRKHDEFLALLPDTPPAGARQVGQQIVEAMRHDSATHTVSVGVAVAVPDEQQSATGLLRRAGSVLQSAQEQGGNRCLGGASPASSPPKSTLARLRDLLPGKRKDSDLKRRTD
jgi:GGDEF domain-containing protein